MIEILHDPLSITLFTLIAKATAMLLVVMLRSKNWFIFDGVEKQLPQKG